jgi:Neuraminidase (sialidase)
LHELHAVEAADGTIIAQIRNHNAANKGETLQSESKDGGKTWTLPHSIGVWGLPSHLMKLRDGRLVMTYGHRRPPFGNQARLSTDNGQTWSDAIILSGDGAGGDLGYPSTVELADGTLLSVWYEKMKEHPHAVLRQATWKLN